MRIAVVGAGVSGLVAAHHLHPHHDVTVFEADARAGGHAHTVRVDTEDATHWVDTGFIVHNDRNYPEFEALLERLGVATQPSEMSFSVSDERGDFEYNGSSPNGLFAKRRHLVDPRFLRMVADLVRFNREARELLAAGGGPGEDGRHGDGPSLAAFLERGGYSEEFVQRLIVPQASAVWSADPAQMWSLPAAFLAEFFANHGMLGFTGRPGWRTIRGGSHRYVAALTAPLGERLRLNAPVRAIAREPDAVVVTPHGAQAERFDHVVVATHSDQALALLEDPTAAEAEVLGAIAYQPNQAVLHTDRRSLPRRRRAWASWNFHLGDRAPGRTRVTYLMNRLQRLRADRQFCVTLNRTADVDPAHVIEVIDYAHPVFTQAAVRAQRRHGEISGVDRTHYCGAYWGWGFHEDGVVSARRAVNALERVPA